MGNNLGTPRPDTAGQTAAGPHQGQPVLAAGLPLGQARAGMVMLHGRGAGAEDMIGLAQALNVPGFTYLAPQAADYTWYPRPFLSPIDRNEPWLSSALARVGEMIETLAAAEIPPERMILLGFSQGACLALEYAARNARRYGGVAGLSGGLIGPDGTPRDYAGSLSSTPVFLGCSDVDPHVPASRVRETGNVLKALDGDVTLRLYRGMGHTVNDDEIAFVREMMHALVPA